MSAFFEAIIGIFASILLGALISFFGEEDIASFLLTEFENATGV